MKYFWMKLFYSKSSLQCNSVMTVNKRPSKHVPGSIYKEGTYPDRIFSFLKDNLMEEKSMGKENPVLGLLEQMKNYTGFSGDLVWFGIRFQYQGNPLGFILRHSVAP